jgi:hypothetical protein
VRFLKKYFEGITAVIAALAFFYFGAKLLSPGSYVNAEEYELPVNEQT